MGLRLSRGKLRWAIVFMVDYHDDAVATRSTERERERTKGLKLDMNDASNDKDVRSRARLGFQEVLIKKPNAPLRIKISVVGGEGVRGPQNESET